MIETLYLSAITVAELRFGLAAMPQGKRRAIYLERLEREVLPAFSGRAIPFDPDTSRAYAGLLSRADCGQGHWQGGRVHCRSAATRGFVVATRDTSPFQAAGLAVINPWAM